MATENEIIDSTSFRSRAAAVAAEPGSIAIQNVGNVLKSVDDQGVATTLGAGGGAGTVTSVAATAAGLLVIGGTPTIAPTVGIAALAAHTIIANLTAGSAVPTAASVANINTMLGIQDPSAVAITGGSITGTTIDLIGIAGGRTIVGGTAASESLTYSSTSHATKGKHIWGTTAKMQFDEAAVSLEIGGVTGLAGHILHAYSNTNASTNIYNWNESTGTAARTQIQCATGAGYAITFGMQNFSSGYTTSGQLKPGVGLLELAGGAGNLVVSLNQASGSILLTTTSSRTLRYEITSAGLMAWFAATPVAQQTVGANVNNVAASGTTGQFDDFTNGTVYATDYAALHATIYQLTRTVAQMTVALRNYGLGV
jgi:hypothetical protein